MKTLCGFLLLLEYIKIPQRVFCDLVSVCLSHLMIYPLAPVLHELCLLSVP